MNRKRSSVGSWKFLSVRPKHRSGLEIKDNQSPLFMVKTIGSINLFRESKT